MHLRIGRSGRTIEARSAAMRLGACLLAMVATDAEGLVDQQDIRGLAESLLHEKSNDVAGLRLGFHAQVFADPLADLFLHAPP